MKEKLVVFGIAFSLLLSGMLIVVGGEMPEGEISGQDISEDQMSEEDIEDTKPEVIYGRDPIYGVEGPLRYESWEHTPEEMLIDRRRGEERSTGVAVENEQKAQLNDQFYESSREKNSYLSEGISSAEASDIISSRSSKRRSDYEVHDPIRIDSDSDFADKAEEKDWPGSGTEEEPYIIEGYEIDGDGHGYSIYIGNVTDHFEVKGCLLYNANEDSGEYFTGSGLHLFDTSNGDVRDNILSNNYNGIFLSSSEDNTVVNNEVTNNGLNGIWLHYSDRNDITGNIVSEHNLRGIDLYVSDHNHLASNTVSNSSFGIDIAESERVLVTNNTLINDGIYIWGDRLSYWDSHSVDTSNTVNGNPVYYLKDKEEETVPAGAGQVILVNCNNMVVENQNVSDGTAGIVLGFSDNNMVMNNTASNNDKGIRLFKSHHNTIIDNTLLDSSNTFITLSYGIQLAYSDSNEIIGNTFSNNDGHGLYVAVSDDNFIANNTAENNLHDGIKVYGSQSNALSNNIAANCDVGLRIEESNENTLTNNFVSDNRFGIALVLRSDDNSVRRNIVVDNEEHQAADSGENEWDAGDPAEGGGGGNYWSDWKEKEIEDRGDGIGEPGYDIWGNGNQDNYPWVTREMTRYSVDRFKISVDDITAGESPVIELYDSYNEEDRLLEGKYSVVLEIDGDEAIENLTFDEGFCRYMYEEMFVAGDYAAEVTIDGVTESDTFNVEPKEPVELNIDPDEDQEVIAGESIEFTAEAYDEYDNLITDGAADFEWENADDGVFEETEAGGYEVTASYDGISSDSVTVTVEPAEVDYIEISVADSTIRAGESVEFTAEAYDEYDNLITDGVADFEWENADDGVFDETEAGEYEVTASYDGISSDSVTVTVEPAEVDYIEISVADSTIRAGESVEFTAEAYDEYDNLITDGAADFEWENADDGVFDETEAGGYEVTASYEGVTSEPTAVTVEPGEVDRVLIDTDDDQEIGAGETIEFSAEAYDEYDNLITDEAEEFEWENADDGVFDETEAGEYDVRTLYGGVSSYTLVVTVEAGEVDRVLIDPDDDQEIEAGETIEFTAEAYDEYDNLITDDPADFDWENADDGVFDETEGGDFDVSAEYDGVSSDPVTVTVETLWSNYWWLITLIVIVAVVAIGIIVWRKQQQQSSSSQDLSYEERTKNEKAGDSEG